MYTIQPMIMDGVLKGWVKWRDVSIGIMKLVGEQENAKYALVMVIQLNAIFIQKKERKRKR